MKMPARMLTRLMAVLAAGSTAGLMIWAAQPWGTNYAYQTGGDYLSLAKFIGWALSAYVFLFFAANSQPDKPLLAPYRFAGSALLCVASVGFLINAMVINVDPQGALIVIFLPLGQWLFLALLELSLRLLPGSVGGVR